MKAPSIVAGISVFSLVTSAATIEISIAPPVRPGLEIPLDDSGERVAHVLVLEAQKMRMRINPPGESKSRFTSSGMSGPAARTFAFSFHDHGPFIWPPLRSPRISYRSAWEAFTLAVYEFDSIVRTYSRFREFRRVATACLPKTSGDRHREAAPSCVSSKRPPER